MSDRLAPTSLPERLDIDEPPAVSHEVGISGTATCSDQDIWGEVRRIIEHYRAADEGDDAGGPLHSQHQ